MALDVHRQRATAVATLCVAALVLAPVLFVAQAEGAPTDPTDCATPMGMELEARANAYLGETSDPVTGLIDTLRLTGAQRSPATIVNFNGRLALIAEVKVDKPTSFTWATMVRLHSNQTGWNTTPIWLSSLDTAESYPIGYHIHPRAAFLGSTMFVAWTAEGSPLMGPLDRLVVMRSLYANGTAGPWLVASDTDSNKTNQHPVLTASNGSLFLAYSTSDGTADPQGFRIVSRQWREGVFSPSINVSSPPTNWADVNPSITADPQGNLYLAWSRVKLSGAGAKLMFAVNNGSGWGNSTEVAELGEAPGASPGLAYYKGAVFVAFATNFPPDINGSDYDVHWVRYDPATGTMGAAAEVNPEPSGGDDLAPSLSLVGDDLLVGWTTSEDFYYTRGTDPDPVYRAFNGTALGPLHSLTNDTDNASDGAPHFIKMGDYLYAHWFWTPPSLPGTPRGDSREAIRLVAKPAQWTDFLQATYYVAGVSENGSSRILVEISPIGRVNAQAGLVIRLADGSLYPLAADGSFFAVWAPIEPSRADFEVLACGIPLPLQRGLGGDPPPPTAERNWNVEIGLGLAGAALLLIVVWRALSPKKQ